MALQRILVIEDESAAREALGGLLAEEGYEVRTAATGRRGLELLQDFRPEMVMCDYYLPDIDGLRVLRHARAALPEGVVFAFLTAASGGPEVESVLRREADLFFHKPLDFEVLRHALRRIPQRLPQQMGAA